MHPHHHPFYDSFWSPTAAQDPLPNFSYGLSVLHQKLQQSIEENTVIANYLRQRAAVERSYAQQLASLQAVPKPGKAFERDVGAGLKKCFEVVRAESIESVETHRRRGDNLVSTALDPLERFGARYERIVTRTRKDMEQCIARFDQSGKELEQAKATYNAKCRALQMVDPDFVPPDQPTWLGRWTFTQRQIAHLLDTMEDGMNGQTILDRVVIYCQQQEPPTTLDDEIDDWDPSVAGIRKSSSSSTGRLSCVRFTEPEKDALQICEALVAQGFLQAQKPSSGFRLDVQYIPHYPTGALGKPDDYDDNEQRRSVESTSNSSSSIGGIFGRWGRSNHSQQQQRDILIQEMNQADRTYRASVKHADRLRMQTEESLCNHYEEMQSLELERVQTIKQAFITMAATLSNTIPLCAELYDRMMLYQETLKPDKDVEFIVEQYRTGRFCPRPILYNNFYYGSAMDQVFGVSLEEYSRMHKVVIPPLISKGLAAIEAGFSKIYKEERVKMWVSELQLDQAHEARERLNDPARSLVYTAEHLERYDVQVLTSVIRLYLMELPECLITFELYDPIKLLYTNQHLDDPSKVASITKLLATLPSSHYYTLKALMAHFHGIDQVADDNEDNAKLDDGQEAPTPMNASKDIAASISHILVRPQVESTLNLHDRHPYRLVRDLIKHYDTIFSEQSVQSHENHIHRRAIVATSPTSPDNETSLDDDNNNNDFSGSSAASSSGSSVLLSTPTTNANFVHDTDEPLKSPTSPRSGSKRNLLSFMRRSSSTATSSSSSDRTPTTSSIPTASSTPRRPIPMPSKSTLFEDPDGDDDDEEDDESRTTRPSSNDDRTSLSTEDQPMKNMTSDKALPPVPSNETPSTKKDEQGDNVTTTTTTLPDTTNKEPISMEKEGDKPQQHHSRMSSVGTFQGSLDSFFKDDDL